MLRLKMTASSPTCRAAAFMVTKKLVEKKPGAKAPGRVG
jgi:hypothetical protein